MPKRQALAEGRRRVKIARLRPAPWNPRTISADRLRSLAASLAEDPGLLEARPILATPDGTIYAGNARYLAARELGWEEVPCIITKLSRREARRRALRDNNQWGEWLDPELGRLLADLGDGPDLQNLGFSGDDLERLRALSADPAPAPEPPVEVPEEPRQPAPVPEEPITQPGDLWLLGPHRVLCADTFAEGSLERLIEDQPVDLVLTDPPYAIYGSSTGIGSEISDDRLVRPFFASTLRLAASALKLFGHTYVCCDWRSWPSWWEAARNSGLTPKNLIVWDKGGGGLGASYLNAYELVGFFARLPPQTVMRSSEQRGQRPVYAPNIWRGPRVPSGRLHNAEKPVPLFAWLIGNSTDPEERILDPFLGSGTTIIAAEQTGRVGLGIEIEPRFVDVTVNRWEAVTGRKAERCPAERS